MFKKRTEQSKYETFIQDDHTLISCTCGKSKLIFIPIDIVQKIVMCEGCGYILRIDPVVRTDINHVKNAWNKQMMKRQNREAKGGLYNT